MLTNWRVECQISLFDTTFDVIIEMFGHDNIKTCVLPINLSVVGMNLNISYLSIGNSFIALGVMDYVIRDFSEHLVDMYLIIILF